MKEQGSSHRQRGVTMVEVLVAALILSFGITSIGAMMLSTLQNSRSAILRSRAIELAQDMAERIRNNVEGRLAYDTSVTTPNNWSCFQDSDTPATPCSPSQLAAHDIWHWNRLVASGTSGLPAARASITVSGTAPREYAVTILWRDGASATTTDDDGNTFTDSYALRMTL